MTTPAPPSPSPDLNRGPQLHPDLNRGQKIQLRTETSQKMTTQTLSNYLVTGGNRFRFIQATDPIDAGRQFTALTGRQPEAWSFHPGPIKPPIIAID